MGEKIDFEEIRSRQVKQDPHFDQVEREMHRIGMGNFLGTDARRLIEILDADHDTLHAMGLTDGEIAKRLEELTERAKASLGEWLLLEGRYEVRAEEHRGMIPCPWEHPNGMCRKSFVRLEDRVTGISLIWSDLSVHLIRHHGFYQGRGSPFRLEPKDLKRVFWGSG